MSGSIALAVLGLGVLGCNAMQLPCLVNWQKESLLGHWRYVGRPPGPAAEQPDVLPYPDSLDLRADGSYTIRFSGAQLERLRETSPEFPADGAFRGAWTVGTLCPGDLFLPTQWLRFHPGPRVRRFDLQAEQLILFYPFASGFGHEMYAREGPAL